MCAASADSVNGPAPSAAADASMSPDTRGAFIARASPSGRGLARRVTRRLRTDHRAHVDQLGKERMLERATQESDAGRSAGSRLVADDALDGFHVPEAPQLEAFLDIDQLFAHVVRIPPALR